MQNPKQSKNKDLKSLEGCKITRKLHGNLSERHGLITNVVYRIPEGSEYPQYYLVVMWDNDEDTDYIDESGRRQILYDMGVSEYPIDIITQKDKFVIYK